MNTESARGDDCRDLVDSYLTRIIDFEGATGNEATILNRKYDGFEERPIELVEWAIDEDTMFGLLLRHFRS
jgi:hypothetical protein